MSTREMTRDITYSTSARTRSGRALIRMVENATGRLSLIRRARGYENDIASGTPFWDVMVERYGISLDIVGGALSNIPANGPLIIIANHPYGILDGLILGHLLQRTRGDFRLLANSVFRKADAINKVLLPISFDGTKEATQINVETRVKALKYLSEGGAMGVFPGGTVSTAAKPFGQPMDPSWRNFTARMIAKSNATIVPVFFDGQNSRLFQLASHLNYNLRLALLLKEFRARTDAPVRIVIGKPISRGTLGSDATAMMQTLRRATYALSPRPLTTYDPGYEFEERYKTR